MDLFPEPLDPSIESRIQFWRSGGMTPLEVASYVLSLPLGENVFAVLPRLPDPIRAGVKRLVDMKIPPRIFFGPQIDVETFSSAEKGFNLC